MAYISQSFLKWGVALWLPTVVQAFVTKNHDCTAYKKPDSYFSQFWRLEVWDQGASVATFWWECSSTWQTPDFLLCHQKLGREQASSLVSSYRVADPTHQGSTFKDPSTSQRPHFPILSHWELDSIYEFGEDTNIQPIATDNGMFSKVSSLKCKDFPCGFFYVNMLDGSQNHLLQMAELPSAWAPQRVSKALTSYWPEHPH